MSSMQEIHATSSADCDPQQQFTQQFQTSDLQVHSFSSLVTSSHSDPSPLSQDPAIHMHVSMPSLYPQHVDPSSAVPIAMHLPMSSLPTSEDLSSAMDVVAPPPDSTSASPPMLSDLPTESSMYSMDPRLTNIDPVDPTHPLLSSPSATSASTNPSHASSPALNGVAPSYSAGTSSLASALDGMAVARSRSGSAASPAHLTSSTSDLGFPSSGSAPPGSAHGSGFQFPPPCFEDPLQAQNDSSMPDVPGGAHLLVLGDMLKNIARTASTGSEACHMGQSGDAKEIVTLLKKNVLLVAELVSAMQLDDGSRGSHPGSGPGSSTVSLNGNAPPASASAAMSTEQSQQQQQQQRVPPLSQQPSMTSITSSSSGDSTSDGSELSRKRCASSVAGDRVVKSMKLEPPEDSGVAAPPLQIPPAAGVPPPMMPQTNFSYTYPMSSVPPSLSSVAEIAAVPPPISQSLSSASRPPSSAGIPTHLPLGMLPETAQPVPPGMHPALQQPSVIDPVTSLSHPTADYLSSASAPGSAPPVIPGYAPGAMWPDGRVAPPRQHHHSLSTGSILTVGSAMSNPIPIPAPAPATMSYPTPIYSPTQRAHLQQQPPLNAASATLGRASRSHSISQLHAAAAGGNPFAYVPDSGVPHPTMYESTVSQAQSRPGTSAGRFSRPSSPEYDEDSDEENWDQQQRQQGSGSNTNRHSPVGDGGGSSSGSTAAAEGKSAGEGGPRGGAGQRRMSRTSPSANEGANNHGNEVPQEYRAEVERIFFEFLNAICSNLDATDSKGEPIHQTLMAKKMQRLDESPDFRPFKFRIQAFTNAFLEEIRNFLWNQPYISRFNEEGKKSKSKGNHIWHVDAKKSGDGGWVFRPFKRRLAGTPPGVAYVGLRWTWTPRIWDPQASRANMPVTYSSPSLPSWLSWKDDSLTGIPPPDAQSCDVTVEARVRALLSWLAVWEQVLTFGPRMQFMQDGKEEVLTHTVHVTIAPMAATDHERFYRGGRATTTCRNTSAVAQAVDMVGPLSSEVDVLMTAKSLLQHQARVPTGLSALDPTRSHSTGNSPPGPFDLPPPVAMPPPPGAVYFPSS
ncbi:hypothetical protein BN946_scf184799.g52 [Trametes cinnabarina]|uniref:Uncharacterized protein n=1 Tax=Pycnoporus cinnabarinus TaxID=5643 RepID=A0A060S244_PYCCI|nr:hypothetical protein BN946_scf184799.g52 [Trametes cinnabarina]